MARVGSQGRVDLESAGLGAGADPFGGAITSPFARLRALLEGIPPGAEPIDMTIGEPRHAFPPLVMERIGEAQAEFGKYPPIAGTPALRQAIADWHARRYGLGDVIDPERHVLALNGSREGLFSAIFLARARRGDPAGAMVLIPNPFYQAYLAAALAAGAEPRFLDSPRKSGYLPDLDALERDTALLRRTVAFYLCSPANPQGAVADADYLERAIRLARAHDALLLVDECYSEIYTDAPPPGVLEVAAGRTGSLSHVVAFNSLSKRSNVPGLRSGFVAGDETFIRAFRRFRNVACPQVPLPIQNASVALWEDETHVAENRRLYAEKFAIADAVLAGRFGHERPAGGFFLWLDMSQFGGGEKAAVTLWKRSGVKVLPGAYLTHGAHAGAGGESEGADRTARDPGSAYVRLALVQDAATTREALGRMVACLA